MNKTVDLGFTGSRYGMTNRQLLTFNNLLMLWNIKRMRHGCCVGADEQAMKAVYDHNRKIRIIGHPPLKPDWYSMAAVLMCDALRPPKDYHARDRDIVEMCTVLVATPKSTIDRTGGTWYTVHHALRLHVPTFVIKPNGAILDPALLQRT